MLLSKIKTVALLGLIAVTVGCQTAPAPDRNPCPPVEYVSMGGNRFPVYTYDSMIQKRKCETYIKNKQYELEQFRMRSSI